MAQIVHEYYRFSRICCDERSAYGRGEPSKVSLERGSVSDEQAKEISGGGIHCGHTSGSSRSRANARRQRRATGGPERGAWVSVPPEMAGDDFFKRPVGRPLGVGAPNGEKRAEDLVAEGSRDTLAGEQRLLPLFRGRRQQDDRRAFALPVWTQGGPAGPLGEG
jgi:hypothetical protein